MIGEISMFSPSRKRTVTAVCETGGELLQMSDHQVLRLYHQNPKFGFHIVRLITRRLIENYEALASKETFAEVGLRARDPAEETSYPMSDKRPVAGLRQLESRVGRGARRSIAGVAWSCVALALIAYAGWLFAPYLTSVLFRDAAATTWINVATAPIRGNMDGPPPVRWPTAGRGRSDREGAQLAGGPERDGAVGGRGRARRSQRRPNSRPIWRACRTSTRSGGCAPPIMPIPSRRTSRSTSTVPDGSLVTSWSGWRWNVPWPSAGRRSPLKAMPPKPTPTTPWPRRWSSTGCAPSERMPIAHAEERLQAAGRGVFLASDGRNPEWAFQSQDRLLVELAQAMRALADAEAALAEARIAATGTREAFELISASPIVAPPGSLVWSVLAGAGAALEAGTPVAEWIDCDVILVDVPASDVEVGLLREGMPADVVLEGEMQVRQGSVLLDPRRRLGPRQRRSRGGRQGPRRRARTGDLEPRAYPAGRKGVPDWRRDVGGLPGDRSDRRTARAPQVLMLSRYGRRRSTSAGGRPSRLAIAARSTASASSRTSPSGRSSSRTSASSSLGG